jgi:predicted SAM-dependent methyltransferase
MSRMSDADTDRTLPPAAYEEPAAFDPADAPRELMICGCEAARSDRTHWYGQYYLCTNCGLIQTKYNVPPEHYNSDYFRWIKTLRPWHYVYSQAERVSQLLQHLRPITGAGTLACDYGCGNGEFAAALQWAFADCVTWIGCDKFSRAAWQRTMPADVDYIHCIHVLEHVTDPVGTLREMYRKANRGAVAFFQVPHEKLTIQAYKLLRRPPDLRDNGHVTIYDRASFRKCIERAGWKIASCDYDPCADDIAAQLKVPRRAMLWQRLTTLIGKSCYITATAYKA